jgi:hypothetical protein
MATLLALCRQCGLTSPDDFVRKRFDVMVTEAAQRKLEALAERDRSGVLMRQLYEASGQNIEAVLAGDRHMPRSFQARGKRLLMP